MSIATPPYTLFEYQYNSFTTESNPKTLAVYPYEFTFTVTFRLNGAALDVIYGVVNRSGEELPFLVGGHPASFFPKGSYSAPDLMSHCTMAPDKETAPPSQSASKRQWTDNPENQTGCRVKAYDMPRHGFVKDAEFEIAAQGEDFVTLKTESNPKTLAVSKRQWTDNPENQTGCRVSFPDGLVLPSLP